jgi:hypothetical protein
VPVDLISCAILGRFYKTCEFKRIKKKQALAMAQGGLGLVQVHKNEFEAAIPELEQAVALGSNEDPEQLLFTWGG